MAAGYMTTAEVAERFRRPEATVRWWRYIGYGPDSVKVSKECCTPSRRSRHSEAQLRAEAAEKAAARSRGGMNRKIVAPGGNSQGHARTIHLRRRPLLSS